MKTKKTIIISILLSFLVVSSVFSQTVDSVRAVVAVKGDGIYKILRENGYVAKDYYHKFVELNKTKIKEDDSLILGEIYYLPELDVVSNIPVIDSLKKNTNRFDGLMYSDTVFNNKLNGSIIYLISGHGGPDPGAVAIVDGNTLCEDEYAYDICLRMAVAVEENGGKVYMIISDPDDNIRDEKYLKVDYDEYCWPDLEIPRNHNLRLQQRADAVNTIYAENKSVIYQRVVEVHLDSRSANSNVDVFFYHFPGSSKGKATAEAFQKIFAEKYARYQPYRGYSGTVGERTLLVMKKVLPPAVLIELGNIQSEKDRKRFLDADNRQAIAKWLVEALILDYEAQIKK